MPAVANAVDFKNVTVPKVCVNVGMAPNVPPVSNVKDPEVIVKPVLQLIVPLARVNVGPLKLKFKHEIVPVPIDNVPPV